MWLPPSPSRGADGDAPFTYFCRARRNKKSHSQSPASVEKSIRRRPAQIADHRDAKNPVAKHGRRAREFLFLEYGRPRRPTKGRFSHTLTRKVRFCTRYRLRTEKKFVFGTRCRLRTGKKFTPTRRRPPENKLCIFSITDGEKVRFCTRYRLRTGKTTR